MANEPGNPTPSPSKGGTSVRQASEPDAAPAPAEGPSPEFKSFLVGLATDPAQLGRFIKDPEAVLKDSGLSQEDQDALRSGNPTAIYTRLLPTPAPEAAQPQPVLVVVVDVTQGQAGTEGVSLRTGTAGLQTGGAIMFPQFPQFPQITFPQITFPQITFPQIFPQIQIAAQPHAAQLAQAAAPSLQITFPQITFPQILATQFPQFPQISPLQISPLQISPLQVTPPITPLQVFPQITPLQIGQPQIHPQIVQPQITPLQISPLQFPQITPLQIFPQITPLQIAHPQIHPQIIAQQMFPQIFPQVFPQIFPQIFTPGGTTQG